MSICKNKVFNRFLFFSLVFFLLGVAISSVVRSRPEVSKEIQPARSNTVEIRIQQREIIGHLERIEDKIIVPRKNLSDAQ